MEEQVGQLWHRLVTRAASRRFPEQSVTLPQVRTAVGIVFRALGGDVGLNVEAAGQTEYGARRSLLQRIAGSGTKAELAWRDEQSIRLPAQIDCFPERSLNRDLYLWLAALSVDDDGTAESWIGKNQRLTCLTLDRYPGLKRRYRRLVDAHMQQRPDPAKLSAAEARQEQAIRRALQEPGCVDVLPQAPKPPFPVPLWMHPAPPYVAPQKADDPKEIESEAGGRSRELEEQRRRRAERTDAPDGEGGLITIRMENIFSWAEFAKVDRGTDSDDDLEQANDVAEDMDLMSVARDGKSSAGKLRFDLDLPSEGNDDLVLGEGFRLPEWDYKHQRMQPEHCRIVPMVAADAGVCALPEHLRRTAKRLRAQFQHLAPDRVWHRAQQDGCEIDIDAYLRFRGAKAAGSVGGADGLYRDLRIGNRSLACLLLADLSLSTDAYVSDTERVIDVIRDSLFLFSESLAATGDRFAVYGFSSRKRDPVRFHQIKTFDEHYNAGTRGRIAAIKPGYYTRMGAAIRRGIGLLKDQPANRRLLLLLTDGKPNDLDKYEGRYGIEDTRHAISEARQAGLQPFCVTIDDKGNDYLPHLFGSGGFVVIRRPQELPLRLPMLYARLTR